MRQQRTDATLVERAMGSRPAVAVMSAAPVPLWLARRWLLHDDRREAARDGWHRLRDAREAARYAAVREAVENYSADGLVLDVGCSQGILQEGLRYGSYLGVDRDPKALALASRKTDPRTRFVEADAASYVANQAPTTIVLNEVLYYLPDPLAAVRHHAQQLAPGGVLIVSIFARTWASRRLLRQLAADLEVVDTQLVTSAHLAWSVVVYRTKEGKQPGLGSTERR